MDDESIVPDLVAALIITLGLFIGSLGIFDAAQGADFSPAQSPCRGSFGQRMPDSWCES